MNESVTKYCVICQINVEQGVIFHFVDNDCKLKLLDFLPEIGLHLTQNSVICDQCMTQTTDVQEFQQVQVKHELLQQDVPSNNNLKEVLVNDNAICVREKPGVEKIKEEFNVGLIKDEVCDSQNINTEILPKLYYCYDCGHCTDIRWKLIRHINRLHRKKGLTIYQCDKCDYKSSSNSGWNYHKLTHINKKPFKCTQCHYAFRESKALKNHMHQHTGNHPFQCDKCDYKCSYKTTLKKHILSQHTSEKPFQCDKCDYKSKYKSSLKDHTLSQHSIKNPFHCDKCDFKGSSKASLKKHNLIHTNEKPFKCTQCNYASIQSDHLKRHMYTHTGKYPLRCDKCDYRCIFKSRLEKHTLSQHTSEKPFHCDKCDYTSSNTDNLRRHKLIHTNEKPFKCIKCNHASKRSNDLKRHILSRHPNHSRKKVIYLLLDVSSL